MSRRQRHSEDATVNLTPMIDVVFLLVIFFMVGSEFSDAESRIRVDVPSVAEMPSITRLPDERVVEISSSGDVMLDGTAVSLDQLAGTLRDQHAAYPALKVAVRGDGNAPFQRIAEVLQVIRSSGVEQMGIAAKGMRR